jgi:hypothetical protein
MKTANILASTATGKSLANFPGFQTLGAGENARFSDSYDFF